MATDNKDFKVKNGLVVANGGTFGGTVSVATPTSADHAATKAYVDSIVSSPTIPVDNEAPLNPINGQLWYDIESGRVKFYYSGQWIPIANLVDAETLTDHTHNQSSGFVDDVFVSAGYFNEIGELVDAGYFNQSSWQNLWDGGDLSTEIVYTETILDAGEVSTAPGTTIIDAGFYNSSGSYIDSGYYNTNSWQNTWDAEQIS